VVVTFGDPLTDAAVVVAISLVKCGVIGRMNTWGQCIVSMYSSRIVRQRWLALAIDRVRRREV
jgi:hypothetical protein